MTPLEADVVLADDVEAAQVLEPVDAAKFVAEGGRGAVAVLGLVQGKDDVTPASELDSEPALRFAGVDVAVHREDSRRGRLRRRVRRHIEMPASQPSRHIVQVRVRGSASALSAMMLL